MSYNIGSVKIYGHVVGRLVRLENKFSSAMKKRSSPLHTTPTLYVVVNSGANPTSFELSRPRVFKAGKIFFITKTRYAICCVVIFYSAGVVTLGRRIGSRRNVYNVAEGSFLKLP
jgi:hypothetical protein